jgi:mannitol/fructose-specific phosphotransferase system IIA component (Ntr-type)
MKAATMEQGLGELLKTIEPKMENVSSEQALSALLERENQGPTVVTEGVVIPHARVEGLEKFFVCIGTSREGIPAVAPHEGRFHLIFLIVSPKTRNAMMLQTLAAIAKLLSSRETHEALVNVKAPGKIIKVIEESGVDVKRTLVANDIMDKTFSSVTLDTPLRKVLELISTARDDALPVLDEKQELLGEISSKEIIRIGLPDYMGMLSNVSFLTSFEPFETFFEKEHVLKVKDLFQEGVLSVSSDTPIVEVAYQMISSGRRRVYITRDNKLEGIIYRKDIITRILQG